VRNIKRRSPGLTKCPPLAVLKGRYSCGALTRWTGITPFQGYWAQVVTVPRAMELRPVGATVTLAVHLPAQQAEAISFKALGGELVEIPNIFAWFRACLTCLRVVWWATPTLQMKPRRDTCGETRKKHWLTVATAAAR
jgi:hypothetical protein